MFPSDQRSFPPGLEMACGSHTLVPLVVEDGRMGVRCACRGPNACWEGFLLGTSECGSVLPYMPSPAQVLDPQMNAEGVGHLVCQP